MEVPVSVWFSDGDWGIQVVWVAWIMIHHLWLKFVWQKNVLRSLNPLSQTLLKKLRRLWLTRSSKHTVENLGWLKKLPSYDAVYSRI